MLKKKWSKFRFARENNQQDGVGFLYIVMSSLDLNSSLMAKT